MEWPLAGTLGDGRCDGPMVPRTAVGLVAKLSEAIHHAHYRRLVHLDLRPSNVVYSDRREVKLIVGSSPVRPQSTVAFGTGSSTKDPWQPWISVFRRVVRCDAPGGFIFSV